MGKHKGTDLNLCEFSTNDITSRGISVERYKGLNTKQQDKSGSDDRLERVINNNANNGLSKAKKHNCMVEVMVMVIVTVRVQKIRKIKNDEI